MSRSRLALAISTAALLSAATALAVPVTAQAGPHEAAASTYGDTTGVGVHNAYEQDKYEYFADALDSGASLLELDVWTNVVGKGWRVSHGNPTGNDNNCENAASADELRTKERDQSLDGCLADMRAWHDAHPGHPPILIKVEMKDGFYDKADRGPDEFDALLREKLGDALLRPADVTGSHANLDEAVGSSGWPSRDAMAGKFVVDLIPGTVEEQNPADDLWTDEEYATNLKDLAAEGRLGEAGAFPAVHGAEKGDPRTERYDEALRPWFVVFDGDASAFTGDGIDTAWYQEHGYLTVMTDAHKVAPEIDGTEPTEQEARDRVTQLASAHASFATSDWYPLPKVLSMVVPRG
ncbi:phosphatidylinositol-specific phospholipase C domain-containing protein [Streptomyces winkii]|uniref:phosphatidylinositol-specific phospholipase C domain-containing protein n=1 Tax=Streptomyces winkii TaxID=3051178 RepID=UPI0028D09769|nr:phosphatidylinositol-specific phospholipase C domain-containing protein [Streptomyces sp. DSM 40971]